jgi:hypothetical protein
MSHPCSNSLIIKGHENELMEFLTTLCHKQEDSSYTFSLFEFLKYENTQYLTDDIYQIFVSNIKNNQLEISFLTHNVPPILAIKKLSSFFNFDFFLNFEESDSDFIGTHSFKKGMEIVSIQKLHSEVKKTSIIFNNAEYDGDIITYKGFFSFVVVPELEKLHTFNFNKEPNISEFEFKIPYNEKNDEFQFEEFILDFDPFNAPNETYENQIIDSIFLKIENQDKIINTLTSKALIDFKLPVKNNNKLKFKL